MRAIRGRYDPYEQARGRVDQLKSLGHSVDKVGWLGRLDEGERGRRRKRKSLTLSNPSIGRVHYYGWDVHEPSRGLSGWLYC